MSNSGQSLFGQSLKEKIAGLTGKPEDFPGLRPVPRNPDCPGLTGTDRDSATFFGVDSQAAVLIESIHRCCDFRGDDDQNRAALIVESASCPPHLMADLIDHFEQQAREFTFRNTP